MSEYLLEEKKNRQRQGTKMIWLNWEAVLCFDAWSTCNKYLSHEILCYMCLNLINCFFGQLINCLCSVFELFFPDGFWGSIRPGNVLPKVQTPRFLLVLAIIPFVFHERILLVKFLFFLSGWDWERLFWMNLAFTPFPWLLLKVY